MCLFVCVCVCVRVCFVFYTINIIFDAFAYFLKNEKGKFVFDYKLNVLVSSSRDQIIALMLVGKKKKCLYTTTNKL